MKINALLYGEMFVVTEGLPTPFFNESFEGVLALSYKINIKREIYNTYGYDKNKKDIVHGNQSSY